MKKEKAIELKKNELDDSELDKVEGVMTRVCVQRARPQ